MRGDSKETPSKQRVVDYGEVFTNQREVDAMLDMVKGEVERLDSRCLEPSCGTGNFLVEILSRKLQTIENSYNGNQLEYERNAVLAVTSIYGIEIQEDNVQICRQRLFDCFDRRYTFLFGESVNEDCRKTVRYILERNIVHGDTLNMKTVGNESQPIVLSEWTFVNDRNVQRRDFSFDQLVNKPKIDDLPLFANMEESFEPTPVKEYPLVDFLGIACPDKKQ